MDFNKKSDLKGTLRVGFDRKINSHSNRVLRDLINDFLDTCEQTDRKGHSGWTSASLDIVFGSRQEMYFIENNPEEAQYSSDGSSENGNSEDEYQITEDRPRTTNVDIGLISPIQNLFPNLFEAITLVEDPTPIEVEMEESLNSQENLEEQRALRRQFDSSDTDNNVAINTRRILRTRRPYPMRPIIPGNINTNQDIKATKKTTALSISPLSRQIKKRLNTKKQKPRLPSSSNNELLEYQCSQCEKGFTDKSKFNKHNYGHMMKAKLEKATAASWNHTCSVCMKKCLNASTLKVHMESHLNNKKFGCTICGIKYNLKGNLTAHMEIHKKTPRFVCGFCRKPFRSNYDLETHMNSHTLEKPYKCTRCKKRFSQTGKAKAHPKICSKNKKNDA